MRPHVNTSLERFTPTLCGGARELVIVLLLAPGTGTCISVGSMRHRYVAEYTTMYVA